MEDIPGMSFVPENPWHPWIQDVAGTHLALLLYGFSWFIGTTCGHGCGSGVNHGRGETRVCRQVGPCIGVPMWQGSVQQLGLVVASKIFFMFIIYLGKWFHFDEYFVSIGVGTTN